MYRLILVCLAGQMTLFSACKETSVPPPPPKLASPEFKQFNQSLGAQADRMSGADLGIPDVPKGALGLNDTVNCGEPITFVPPDGKLSCVATKEAFDLVDEGMTKGCSIPARTAVQLIAYRECGEGEPIVRVRVQSSQIPATCGVGGLDGLEGYTMESNLDFKALDLTCESAKNGGSAPGTDGGASDSAGQDTPGGQDGSGTGTNPGGSGMDGGGTGSDGTDSNGTGGDGTGTETGADNGTGNTPSSNPLEDNVSEGCFDVAQAYAKDASSLNAAKVLEKASNNQKNSRYSRFDRDFTCSASAGDVCSMPGKKFRDRGDGFFLVVRGDVAKQGKLMVKIRNHSDKESMEPTLMDPDSMQIDAGVFAIPFDAFVTDNKWRNDKIVVTVAATDKDKFPEGSQCEHHIKLLSPIVLQFDQGPLDHFPAAAGQVTFDHDNDGVRETTGWVGSKVALLALDRNGNGLIDGGAELFGDQTSIGQSKAANGYEALKAFDTNGDQKITSVDPVFSQLRLWFDHSQDGISQPSELKTLADMGVRSLSVAYEKTGEVPSFLANDIRYRSTFEASGCPANGCVSYDVFFSSYTTQALSQK